MAYLLHLNQSGEPVRVQSTSISRTITEAAAMKRTRIRTHPGEVLYEEYLEPLGLSSRQLAEAIGVPSNRVSDIVRKRRGITADTAIRFGRYFGTDPRF